VESPQLVLTVWRGSGASLSTDPQEKHWVNADDVYRYPVVTPILVADILKEHAPLSSGVQKPLSWPTMAAPD
jgi:hypothetical protein